MTIGDGSFFISSTGNSGTTGRLKITVIVGVASTSVAPLAGNTWVTSNNPVERSLSVNLSFRPRPVVFALALASIEKVYCVARVSWAFGLSTSVVSFVQLKVPLIDGVVLKAASTLGRSIG